MLKIINKHRLKSMCRLQSNEKLCNYGVLIHQKIIILQRINSNMGGFCTKCRNYSVRRDSHNPSDVSSQTIYKRQ